MKLKKAQPPSLQIRLSVKDVKPEIWRLMLVSSDVTLARLHMILQILVIYVRENEVMAVVSEGGGCGGRETNRLCICV
jgi:hypothetical protein